MFITEFLDILILLALYAVSISIVIKIVRRTRRRFLRKRSYKKPSKNSSPHHATSQPQRWLSVPYAEKDEAKRLGAKWDPRNKKWYVPDHLLMQRFEKWWPIPVNLINVTEITKIKLQEFVSIDIETTGLDPGKDKIIEIAAVKYRNGFQVESWVSLINPNTAIQLDVTKINGITNDMVKYAPLIDSVMPEFLKFIGSNILIGHKILFDLRFLDIEAKRLGFLFNIQYIDTLQLSRMLFPDFIDHRLATLVKNLNIDINNSHRALDDAKACAEVYMACMRKQNQDNKIRRSTNMIQNFIALPKKKLTRRKYIDVPYSEKDEVKAMGARWDPNRKSWYVPDHLMLYDFMHWYDLTPKCGQAVCPSCNEFALHFFDVQIHDDYLCYRCKAEMPIMLFFLLPEDDPNIESRNMIPVISELSYIKPLSLIPFAREEDVFLEKRFSKTINESYVMHICPECGAHQGDNYIVDDLHQETSIVDSFRVSYCAACDKWEIVERFDVWW